MTEQQFQTLCEQALTAIEDAVDACGADVDIERSGAVLELAFEDGAKIIVNGNAPVRQIWVAARAGGFHFVRSGERWVDTRSGESLASSMNRLVQAQAGVALKLPEL
ncbi:MAG TPA: iron donor protein CyaY [Quisquiliibacterium sp.]|nr:iron donor protein CyaY [Quisquiliibacterium sp.]HQD81475.1 iron donor protein CyaY [Quisquiliibacterium sp.]HQN12769.1 iron donor protein CyaY [Quisquiliibacterium sp.]HQP66478.1 iron donor protein CyaY [Quisquiliibacterium sp.]